MGKHLHGYDNSNLVLLIKIIKSPIYVSNLLMRERGITG